MEKYCNYQRFLKKENFFESKASELRIINKQYNNNPNKISKIIFNNKQKTNIIITLLFIIYINFKEFSPTLINFHSSIITIKINETGTQNIFNGESGCFSDKFDFPDEVIINNETLENILAQYNFERTDNNIQLIWYEPRENWGCLFKDCTSIIEIDFSQFDFSQSIRGNSMFWGCSSITSLNINDFGKVKFKNIGSIFRNMSSLKSLNLSNFDISEVTDIGGMFSECTSLTSLDLSSFKINNDLFITTKLFEKCNNLEYINLNNSYFIPNTDDDFILTKKNLVFCNKDIRIIRKIITKNDCAINDCSDNWRQIKRK